MTQKVTVIRDANGQVVGTQIGDSSIPDPDTGANITLVAKPGQTLHQIDFDVPSFKTAADIDNFHRQLADLLRK